MKSDYGRNEPRRIARGGKPLYGARLGILMLEARFPRIPGDMGNAETWPFPVLYKVIAGASPERVVKRRAEGLFEAFAEGAEELVRLGADGITSNCGFLSLFQAEIARRAGVPTALSSLMQVPWIERLLPPGKRCGVLTVSAENLSAEHLASAGCDPATPVVGTEGGREFSRALLSNALELDLGRAEADILAAGERLLADHPEVGAIVLECTNMSPYALTLAEASGLPVYDIYSFVTWFHAGLRPRDFGWPARQPGEWRERR